MSSLQPSDYSVVHARDIQVKGYATFDSDASFHSKESTFNSDIYINNNIYLYGNNLHYHTLNNVKMNSALFSKGMKDVNRLNEVFSDEDYMMEEGLTSSNVDTEECAFEDSNIDNDKCASSIWDALREKKNASRSVCKCCCEPSMLEYKCVIKLIRNNNLPAIHMELSNKGSIVHNMVDVLNKDNIIQIGLYQTDYIGDIKLLFYNKQKDTKKDDNDGLIYALFYDAFKEDIIAFPDIHNVKAIKLLIT